MWGTDKAAVQEEKLKNRELEQDIQSFSPKIERFLVEINQLILDKPQQTKLALSCLLAGGHVLFEDLPGLGKTTLASALARLAGLHFQRIQFTPDLLPSDVTGLYYFNQKTQEFEFRPGPIMSQIVLSDEINRATPRTQSSLLEAMQEKQVTLEGDTLFLSRNGGERSALLAQSEDTFVCGTCTWGQPYVFTREGDGMATAVSEVQVSGAWIFNRV